MFRCEQCGKVAKSGEKSFKKVTETRERVYSIAGGRTSVGSEIVKEIKICSECNK